MRLADVVEPIWDTSSYIGCACGTLVAGVIVAPGVLLDRVVSSFSCCTLAQHYKLKFVLARREPVCFSLWRGNFWQNVKASKDLKSRFFVKYPFGIIAEFISMVVSDVVAMSLSLGSSLLIGSIVGGFTLLGLIFGPAFLLSCFLFKKCVMEPPQEKKSLSVSMN